MLNLIEMNENKIGVKNISKSLSISSFKLPKINENNLNKSLFKIKKHPKIKIANNVNQINNYFSTKKLKHNLKIHNKEKENSIKSSESCDKMSKPLSKKKNLYVATSHSFRKKNKIIKDENERKYHSEEDEEDKNIHEKKKYSKNLMDNINNKLFSIIIATDLLRKIRDKELLEQDFEKEVRNYQLLKIIELNHRIREGEAIRSINDIKELYNKSKNSTLYNSYFQIKEKEKKKKDLGIKGIKIKSLNLDDIIGESKNNDKGKEEDLLKENTSENVHKYNDIKKSKEKLKYIKYLDLQIGVQLKKDKKKKIKNILIKDNNKKLGLNYFYGLSQVGLTKDGTNKINQESILELVNILGNSKFNIFGIFGGHGKNGHIISRYISRYIKEYFLFSANKSVLKNCKTNKELYHLFSKNNYEFFKLLMYDCDYSLQHSQIDCDYSGTSCLIIILIENHLICSNIGNCRAIILEKKDLFQLTYDQSIGIPEERKRIEKKGGKIISSDEKGILSNEEYKIIMTDKENKSHYIETSRSLGDKMFKKVGVDFAPVITEYIINIETKFVVMATKGLWKILTNKQVAYYINKGYKLSNPLESCRKIIQKVSDKCQKTSNSRDDITIYTLFF